MAIALLGFSVPAWVRHWHSMACRIFVCLPSRVRSFVRPTHSCGTTVHHSCCIMGPYMLSGLLIPYLLHHEGRPLERLLLLLVLLLRLNLLPLSMLAALDPLIDSSSDSSLHSLA